MRGSDMSTVSKPLGLTLKNGAAAPVVYFDGAPCYGAMNGIVEIELAARYMTPKADGTAAVDITTVAHLRCSLNAATNLREALDRAIEMINAPPKAKQN
jgi:hypothetical protein